jgi:hypothetical protein
MNKNKADRFRTGQTKTNNKPCRRGRGQTLPPIIPSFKPVWYSAPNASFIFIDVVFWMPGTHPPLGLTLSTHPKKAHPPKRGYVAACISCASCTFQYVCCQMLWSMSEKLQKKEKTLFFKKETSLEKGWIDRPSLFVTIESSWGRFKIHMGWSSFKPVLES